MIIRHESEFGKRLNMEEFIKIYLYMWKISIEAIECYQDKCRFYMDEVPGFIGYAGESLNVGDPVIFGDDGKIYKAKL